MSSFPDQSTDLYDLPLQTIIMTTMLYFDTDRIDFFNGADYLQSND